MALDMTRSETRSGFGERPPDPALVRLRDLIYQVAGIFQPDSKLHFLEDRCKRRMEATGARHLGAYYERLTLGSDREREMQQLLNEITIGETCFFRNQPQLDAFRHIILPNIIAEKKKVGFHQIRIWSAGCSTGEEPYTLAILLQPELQLRLRDFQVQVLATDLNERSLAKAQEGIYGQYALRNVSPHVLSRFFTAKGGDQYQVNDTVRQMVSFQRLNLLDDRRLMFLRGLDIIFCCNVLIYFDGSSKRRTIQHFFNMLQPYGYLFLGHAESLFGVNEDFRLIHLPGATTYTRSNRQLATPGVL